MVNTTYVPSVDEVARALFQERHPAQQWAQFLDEFVPATPEFAFVREMNASLIEELFDAAFQRWRIRRYMDQMREREVERLTISGAHMAVIDIDSAWLEANCKLPNLAQVIA